MGMVWMGFRMPASDAEALRADPDLLDDLLEGEDTQTSVDLDKAWNGVHWLLTGEAVPVEGAASMAIFGGTEFGEDLGYGPARLLSVEDVTEVATALRNLDMPSLRVRLQPAAMDEEGVYPSIWDEADVFDTFLEPAVIELRDFYAAAAEGGQVVIQTLC